MCEIAQEELNILRLRYSILQEEELLNREKELAQMLIAKKKESVSRLFFFCLNSLHIFIAHQRAMYSERNIVIPLPVPLSVCLVPLLIDEHMITFFDTMVGASF